MTVLFELGLVEPESEVRRVREQARPVELLKGCIDLIKETFHMSSLLAIETE